MADQRLPELNPVVTPALTDIVGVRQSGDTRDKRETIAQILGLAVEANDLSAAVVWANIPQANVPTHTGEVTGAQALVLDPTAISGKTLVSSVASDMVLLWDATDSLLKRANVSDFLPVAEVNDLTAAVVWANIPDGNVPASAVTQHEAALTILESQITDGSIFARVAAIEDISGQWDFTRSRGAPGQYAISLVSATPFQEFNATGAAVDEGSWAWGALASSFVFRSTDDVDGTGTQWLTVNRTAAIVDNVTFGVPILATSYDGILAADLVSKSAAEIIAAEWDFTTNPKIDAAGIDTGTFANARIAAGNVTQHQAALAIASSQLTGLQLTDNSDVVTAAVTDKFVLAANGTGYVGRALIQADISDIVTIGQAEAEAGVATTDRLFTAQRVSQAIAALGGTGDVTKVGTPVDNQVGVWTGDGTLEGDANFVWDGANMFLGGGLLFNVTGAPRILNIAATSLIPNILPSKGDLNVGLGYVTLDTGSIIAGGLAVAYFQEFVNHPKLIIDPNQAGTGLPTLAFGVSGAVGFKGSATTLTFMTGSNSIFKLTGNTFGTNLTGGGAIINQVASATVPSLIVSSADVDTGFGAFTADMLSVICGGLEMMRFVEATVDQVIIGPAGLIGTVALPSLAWGDGDSGFVETADDLLKLCLAGAAQWQFTGTTFRGENITGPALLNIAANYTTPNVVSSNFDPNTGIGGAQDEFSIIAGGVEAVRHVEGSGVRILTTRQSDVNLTADVGSAQGNGLVGSSYNHFSVVANGGDAATLPSGHPVGTQVWIINDGANSMDVFPNVGDDLGAGADTAVSVSAGATAIFLTTVANSTWTTVFNA